MNKSILSKGFVFLAGGIVGSAITLFLVKSKYEQTIEDKNDEIAFLRDRYSEKKSGESFIDGLENGIKNPNESDIQKIKDKVQELGYINDELIKERNDANSMNKTYVIPPEETWEQDYPTITLTYYEADNVLADEKDKIIKNVDELVGDDFASHFGEFEDDCVYIRNDNLKVYYEIIKDNGSYSEVVG